MFRLSWSPAPSCLRRPWGAVKQCGRRRTPKRQRKEYNRNNIHSTNQNLPGGEADGDVGLQQVVVPRGLDVLLVAHTGIEVHTASCLYQPLQSSHCVRMAAVSSDGIWAKAEKYLQMPDNGPPNTPHGKGLVVCFYLAPAAGASLLLPPGRIEWVIQVSTTGG